MKDDELQRICELIAKETDSRKLSKLIASLELLLREEQREIAKRIRDGLDKTPPSQ